MAKREGIRDERDMFHDVRACAINVYKLVWIYWTYSGGMYEMGFKISPSLYPVCE